MANLFDTYWYRINPAVKAAFLFNVRDGDLFGGGSIKKGEIVQGKCGFHVAQSDVNLGGQIVKFQANRQCEWNGIVLSCMALSGLPQGPVPRGVAGKLRHRHCVVARVTPEAESKAKTLGVPVVVADESLKLINLEVASIPEQDKERRAKLL